MHLEYNCFVYQPGSLIALALSATEGLTERMGFKETFSFLLYNGVDGDTPPDLVDRIVYSNYVCLSIALVVSLAAWAAAARHHIFLLCLDFLYIVGTVACLQLNRHHRYLAARTALLVCIYLGLSLGSAAQGNSGQMEHFFLAVGVLAYSMFHPSERRFAVFFALLAIALYAVFVNQVDALWDVDPYRAQHGVQGLWVNQILYLTLFLCSLLGLSNAYARAVKVVNRQREKISEQNRLSTVGAMAANMAHEINSPLSALDMHAHTLLESLESANSDRHENIEIVKKIGAISARISTVIRGYKFLSRASGSEPLSHVPAAQLVESALDLCSGRLRKLNVKVEVNISDVHQTLECRPVAISQVLLNLLNNAIDVVEKLNEADRKIALDVKVENDIVSISVTDSGRIESQELKDKIFDPFFTTKPIGKGTGLGLSIARQSIEQNGGKLYLDRSHPTTRFVIELPVFSPRQAPAVKMAATGKAKILIVDDDPDLVEVLGIVLRRQGYQVTEASSGNKAIAALKEDPSIQIILSDCYMDDGSGKDLLLHVRKSDPHFPLFFMITGQSDFNAQDAMALGAQEFILKPINIPGLLKRIKSYSVAGD